MFCPKCGNHVGDDFGFCPICGNDLNAVRAAEAAEAPGAPDATAAAESTAVMPAASVAAEPPITDESGHWTWDAAAGQWAPTASDTAADAGGPAPGPAPVAKSAKGLSDGAIAGIIVGALVLLALLSAAGIAAYDAFSTSRPVAQVTEPAVEPTASQESSATASDPASATQSAPAAATPQAAVDAWYTAVSKGDIDAIRSTATSDFAAAITPAMFEGRAPATSYRVVGTTIKGDVATIDAQESVSGVDAKTTVTFTVRDTGSGWLVSALNETVRTQAQPAPAPKPNPVKTSLTRSEAIDVVGRFLDAQRQGHNTTMKSLATTRYKNADPGKFKYSAAEAFISFEVTKSSKSGSVWRVTTKESWISGYEYPTYYVVVRSGHGLVDNETYPGQ